MVYKMSSLARLDKILLIAASIVLFLGIIFLPKEAFRIKKTTLVFSQNWGEFANTRVLNALIDEFQKNNPHIIIKFSQETPDIIAFDLLEAKKTGLAGSIEEQQEIAVFINPLFYNIDMLEKSGFDRPPKNRNDFIAASRKIKELFDGTRGISISNSIEDAILPWFWTAGMRPQADFDWTSRAAVETFTFLKQLDDEKCLAAGALHKTEREALDDFILGKSAMFIGGGIAATHIQQEAPKLNFSVTTIPPPADNAGMTVFSARSWNIGIAADSEQKEAALLFLEFVGDRRGEIAAALGAIPGNLNETVIMNKASGEVFDKMRSICQGVEIIIDADVPPDTKKTGAVLKEELQKMWAGLQSPRETAEAVQKKLSL